MSIKYTVDFKQEAVRIALTSGLPRRRVASDLGVGFSTLGKWVSEFRPVDISVAPQADLAKENERLRHENRVLREEREILKKATVGSTGQCNMIYFMKHPEAHNGKNRSTRFIAATKAGTLAALEGRTVTE